MRHSLGVAGLGHTSVGSVRRYTDLVGCVLVPVAVGLRLFDMDSGKPAVMLGAPRLASSSLRGLSSHAPGLQRRALFITWLQGRIFREMPMRPKAFLCSPGFLNYVSAHSLLSERRWVGTHFRRAYSSVHVSGRVCPSSGGSRSRPSDMDSGKPLFISRALKPASSSHRRPSTYALALLGGAMFITWRLGCLILEECRRSLSHYCAHQACRG